MESRVAALTEGSSTLTRAAPAAKLAGAPTAAAAPEAPPVYF
jgi:hypothetical protein